MDGWMGRAQFFIPFPPAAASSHSFSMPIHPFTPLINLPSPFFQKSWLKEGILSSSWSPCWLLAEPFVRQNDVFTITFSGGNLQHSKILGKWHTVHP
jgi:hypothetical protein